MFEESTTPDLVERWRQASEAASRFTVGWVACMIVRVMVSRGIDAARAAAERLAKEPV